MKDTLYYSMRRALWSKGFKIGDFSHEFFEDFRNEYEASPKDGTLYDMALYFPKTLNYSISTNIEFILYLQMLFEFMKVKGEDAEVLPPRSSIYPFLEAYECIVRMDPSLKKFRRKHRIRLITSRFFNITFRAVIPTFICLRLFENKVFLPLFLVALSNIIYSEYIAQKEYKF